MDDQGCDHNGVDERTIDFYSIHHQYDLHAQCLCQYGFVGGLYGLCRGAGLFSDGFESPQTRCFDDLYDDRGICVYADGQCLSAPVLYADRDHLRSDLMERGSGKQPGAIDGRLDGVQSVGERNEFAADLVLLGYLLRLCGRKRDEPGIYRRVCEILHNADMDCIDRDLYDTVRIFGQQGGAKIIEKAF